MIGTAGVGTLGAEWWYFEITSLMAGYLGIAALSAHAIGANMAKLSYIFPLAFAVATATRCVRIC